MAVTIVGAAGDAAGTNADTSTPDVILTRPAVIENDLMIVGHVQEAAGPATSMAAPAGWTQLGTTQTIAGAGHLKIWLKVATASEAATYTFPGDTGADESGGIVVFRGQHLANPVPVAPTYTLTSTATATAHPAPSVTGVVDAQLLTIHAAADDTGPNVARSYTGTPSGMTLQVNSNGTDPVQSWVALGMFTQALTSTAATGVKTATISAGRPALCASIVIVPAPAATGPEPGRRLLVVT